MLNKILIFIVTSFVFIGCSQEHKYDFEAELVYPPVATMQLGPSIFLPKSDFEKLDIIEGTPVRVTINNRTIDLRIYDSFGDDNTFIKHRKYLKFFGIDYKE